MTLPAAPVRWCGWQVWPKRDRPPVDLWTLTATLDVDHVAGSTIAGDTIRALGYDLPEPSEPAPDRCNLCGEQPPKPGGDQCRPCIMEYEIY